MPEELLSTAQRMTFSIIDVYKRQCLYSGKKNLVDLFKDSLSNEIKIIELTERNESK